jgi:endonuclease I
VVQTFSTSNAGTYYSSITGQTCAALKSALRDIITSGHVQLNYADLDNLYMPVTDDRLNDAGTQTIVWDIYTDNPNGPEAHELLFSQFNTGGSIEGQGWNKEHTFPKSWFGGNTNSFPGADLMHIFPADIFVNSGRANLPYGKVAAAAFTYSNGSKKGSSAINFPGYSGQVFEPVDEYKGDVARNYFYMVTRYENNQSSWENLTTEGDVVMDGQAYPSIEIEYLRMLLGWNNSDPVSAKELARNNDVFSFQGNRNPYIDHPEYVGLVWSSSCGLALPVDLTAFKGKLSGNIVLLNWKIERAEGFSHFDIERSVDGGAYTKAGKVRWVANQNDYSFADDVSAISGKIFYRLKMVDDNNVFKYSNVITVIVPGIDMIASLYPNPAKETVNISFRKQLGSNATVYILDASGRNITVSILPPGQFNYPLNVSNLTNGMYLLKCVKDNSVSYIKFLVQR